jgi:hypothetical protein
MKFLAILIAFSFLIQSGRAQKIDTSSAVSAQDTYRNYMGKSKNDKTIALLLLVPGSTMMTVGGVINVRHGNVFTGAANSSRGTTIGLLGSVMAVTSIPFFIAAGRNRKAAFLTLKSEKITMGHPDHSKFSYPALALRIKF